MRRGNKTGFWFGAILSVFGIYIQFRILRGDFVSSSFFGIDPSTLQLTSTAAIVFGFIIVGAYFKGWLERSAGTRLNL